jgi:dihydrofolate reductase
MIVSMVVAMAQNRVIGAKNSLPWYLPDDLRKFRELTTGHAILMGRKTFDSLPKVLPNREHYIVTRSADFKEQNPKTQGNEHVFTVSDPVSALDILQERIEFKKDIPEEVFVIGGGELFAQLLPYSVKLYVTLVKKEIEGDTFFPEIEPCDWIETERTVFDEFDFVVFERCPE